MLVGLVVVGVRLLKAKPQQSQPEALTPVVVDDKDRFHPEIRKRMEAAQFIRRREMIESTCANHPNEPSEGGCAICAKYFCVNCLKTHGILNFCREHYNVFLSANWSEAYTVKSTPDDPEAGVKVVDWKNKVFETEGTPTYVETHYKINVEGDQIESWIVLFARETEVVDIKKRLQTI